MSPLNLLLANLEVGVLVIGKDDTLDPVGHFLANLCSEKVAEGERNGRRHQKRSLRAHWAVWPIGPLYPRQIDWTSRRRHLAADASIGR